MGTKTSPMRLYGRALGEVRPCWPALGGILLLGLLWTPIALVIPLPVKIILDNVIGSAPLPHWIDWLPGVVHRGQDAALWVALAMTVAIALVVLAHNTADWLLRESLAERMVRGLRRRMIRKSLEVSALTAHGEGSQGHSYRIVHDAPALQWVTTYGLGPIIISGFSLSVILVVTAQLSPTVAVVAMVTSLPMVLLIHRSQRRMCDGWHAVKDLDCRAMNGAQEALLAWRVVVNFGQEQRVLRQFGSFAQSAFRARMRVMGLQAGLGALLSLGAAVGTAAILFFCVRDVQTGRLSAGELILITAYVGQLYGPIHTIGTHMSNQQSALASMERSFALIDQPPAIREKPNALPLAAARGHFELHKVAFEYEGSRSVLRDCSLEIPAGSWVGIAGATGAGKTTFANLIVRFIDPVAGSVRLDGHDLREYRLTDLRKQFAVLGQEALLVSGSIEENIAYARPGASREEVVRAAALAHAHDFISALPEGYSTQVGEGGLRLSGGERQRVALARAYLKNAPILILDEPTSALDMRTERAVIEDLKRYMPGRTVFLITHRSSVLLAADIILNVEGERITMSRGAQHGRKGSLEALGQLQGSSLRLPIPAEGML